MPRVELVSPAGRSPDEPLAFACQSLDRIAAALAEQGGSVAVTWDHPIEQAPLHWGGEGPPVHMWGREVTLTVRAYVGGGGIPAEGEGPRRAPEWLERLRHSNPAVRRSPAVHATLAAIGHGCPEGELLAALVAVLCEQNEAMGARLEAMLRRLPPVGVAIPPR